MSSHRYWRVLGIETYGRGALKISGLQLLDGTTRQDASVTATASAAPDSGSLANLQDTNLATAATWAAASGVMVTWDFGSATEVNNVRLGSGDTKVTFPRSLRLQFSEDNTTWSDFANFAPIHWPGARTFTASEPGPVEFIAAGAFTDGIATSITLTPPVVPAGSLLIAAYFRRAAAGAAPGGGWTLISSSGEGVAQISDVWSKVATGSDGPVTFNYASSASVNGQIFAFTGFHGPVTVAQTDQGNAASALYPGGTVSGTTIPAVSADVGLMLAVASTLVISVSPVTINSVDPAGKFVMRSPTNGIAANRLLVATELMRKGYDSSGWLYINLAHSTAVSNNQRWTKHAILLQGPLAIARDYSYPLLDAFDPLKVTMAAPPATFGLGIPIHPSRSAKNFFLDDGSQAIGRVRGTVKEKSTPSNIPLRRRVRLIREVDGMVVREMWSDSATGEYDFQYVDETLTYTVLSYDHAHNYRAVVADNLTLANGQVELMP